MHVSVSMWTAINDFIKDRNTFFNSSQGDLINALLSSVERGTQQRNWQWMPMAPRCLWLKKTQKGPNGTQLEMVTQLPTLLGNTPKHKLCSEDIQKLPPKVTFAELCSLSKCRVSLFGFSSFSESRYMCIEHCACSHSSHPVISPAPLPYKSISILMLFAFVILTSSVPIGLELSIRTCYAHLYGFHRQLKTNTAPFPSSHPLLTIEPLSKPTLGCWQT